MQKWVCGRGQPYEKLHLEHLPTAHHAEDKQSLQGEQRFGVQRMISSQNLAKIQQDTKFCFLDHY